ncbi:MAG: hypothetical protein JRN58_05390 [Nitrososphaerota archaeon]|nr:hypothetical protein [Nitrososphaerota archaeon]
MKQYRDGVVPPKDDFYPLTKEATETVVMESDYHPRRFLSRFNRIISEALGEGV